MAEVVAALPAEGVPQRIYLVPGKDPVNQNIYDEYLWINGAWELVSKSQAIIEAGTVIKINGKKVEQLGFNSDPQQQIDEIIQTLISYSNSITAINNSFGSIGTDIQNLQTAINNIVSNINLICNEYGGFSAGENAVATSGGAIGQYAQATTGFAGGYSAKATANGAVQLGQGTNAIENTLQFRDKIIVDSEGNLYDAGEKVATKFMLAESFTDEQILKLAALADKISEVSNNEVAFSIEIAAPSFNAK